MHEEKLGIPTEHSLVQTKTEWKQKRGQDTDTYWYDELNSEGKIIAKYIVKDSTSMHPPFGNNVTFDKEVL
jgi:hypothetical protein